MYASKDEARKAVWDALAGARACRFPFPPHGRIPNFIGAREAAERLMALPLLRKARRIKVNPDKPQAHVRELALAAGIRVYVPTPKLAGGFRLLDPERIPADRRGEASVLTTMERWAQEVPLRELPSMDAIVNGSVAVTRGGRRAGKGAGYGDLEYAILRELGHPDVPVATTVHPLQVVGGFPADPFDLPLSIIATPGEVIRVRRPPQPPSGIDWGRLTEEDLDAMPVLRELRRTPVRRGAGR